MAAMGDGSAPQQPDRPNHSTRYDIREEADGYWTVYDTFSNRPAKPSTWLLVELPEKDASIYCAIINEKHRARQRATIMRWADIPL
jgi:hypothetical protein